MEHKKEKKALLLSLLFLSLLLSLFLIPIPGSFFFKFFFFLWKLLFGSDLTHARLTCFSCSELRDALQVRVCVRASLASASLHFLLYPCDPTPLTSVSAPGWPKQAFEAAEANDTAGWQYMFDVEGVRARVYVCVCV